MFLIGALRVIVYIGMIIGCGYYLKLTIESPSPTKILVSILLNAGAGIQLIILWREIKDWRNGE